MKIRATPILIAVIFFSPLLWRGAGGEAFAQTNRANTKKFIPYRANYQRMASGCNAAHIIEIRDGTLWAWGWNAYGQLGDGTTIDKSSPVQIGTDNKWVSIASGNLHSLGLKSDGTLWAWGGNGYGQLGDGNTSNQTSPVQIGTDNKWVNVIAGDEHSLGLKSDGTLWAWGGNFYGQLGDGTTTQRTSPEQIGADNKWVGIVAGKHTLGLKSNGTLWAWGYNAWGQLGNGNTTNQNSPVQIGTDNKWVSIAGSGHSLGLKSDGSLWAWGLNNYGQLGDGTTINRYSPIQIGTDTKWGCIVIGMGHSLSLKSDGTLWSWGYNASGQLGDGTISNRVNPIQMGTDTKWVGISGNNSTSLGLKSDGSLWAWGDNTYGQIGDGTTVNKSTPIQTSVTLNVWLSITGGGANSHGLKSDGTIWAWGNNLWGQLGDGTTTNKSAPVQIGTDNKWTCISEFRDHTLGLKSDGTLWAWGQNGWGALGDGTNIQRNCPVQIGADTKWVSISTGGYYSVGLKSDRTLWAWGNNGYGQLGDGTTTNRYSPVQIGANNNWTSVVGGGNQSHALKSDGTLWAWGQNYNGELGDGTTIDKISPVQVGTDNNWVKIAGATFNCFALKSDGTLWAWGRNGWGSLGEGTNISQRTSPVQIGTDNNWIGITGGADQTLGLKSDGTLWAWGWNQVGELGDGTTINKNSPEQIGTDNNWISTVAGCFHSLGLKSDRIQFCATGYNASGQLGDGTIIDKNTFICNTNCIPPPAPIGTNAIICSNSTASLSAIGTGSLGWYSAVTGGTYLGVGANFTTPTLTSTTTYYVQDSTCDASVTRTALLVTVLTSPPATPVASNKTTCYGHTASLSATGTGTLGWYSAATGGSYLGGGADYTTPTLTTNKIYYVQDSTCAASVTRTAVHVTVNPLPTVTASASATTVCAGTTVSLTGGGATSYSWTGGVTNGLGFILSTTTTYTVTGTDGNGCSNTTTKTINVNPRPTVTANASATAVCAGTMVVLTGGGANNYIWTNGVGNGVGFNPFSSATYMVIGKDGNNCTNSAMITITVNPIPNVTTTFSGGIISANQNGATYQWLDCTIGYSPIPSETNQSFTPSFNGEYTVIITKNGCVDTSDCVNVSTTGVAPLSFGEGQGVRLFPNPNNGSFAIQATTEGVYSIMNELGQTIQHVQLNRKNNYTMNIENLSNGIYFIVGFNDNQMIKQKIVVTK